MPGPCRHDSRSPCRPARHPSANAVPRRAPRRRRGPTPPVNVHRAEICSPMSSANTISRSRWDHRGLQVVKVSVGRPLPSGSGWRPWPTPLPCPLRSKPTSLVTSSRGVPRRQLHGLPRRRGGGVVSDLPRGTTPTATWHQVTASSPTPSWRGPAGSGVADRCPTMPYFGDQAELAYRLTDRSMRRWWISEQQRMQEATTRRCAIAAVLLAGGKPWPVVAHSVLVYLVGV